MNKHAGLPVKGYQEQTTDTVSLVNTHKQFEELLLRRMDSLKESENIDQRWLAIARTQLEQGFMALNRAVFQPGRAELDVVFLDCMESIDQSEIFD